MIKYWLKVKANPVNFAFYLWKSLVTFRWWLGLPYMYLGLRDKKGEHYRMNYYNVQLQQNICWCLRMWSVRWALLLGTVTPVHWEPTADRDLVISHVPQFIKGEIGRIRLLVVSPHNGQQIVHGCVNNGRQSLFVVI